jgi:sugar lactone lactonase YvrE
VGTNQSGILRFGPHGEDHGAILWDAAPVFPGQFYSTFGIAFDSSGNLYASNDVGDPYGLIEKFSPRGTDLGAFASTGLDVPTGMAFDSSGNLYVANADYYFGPYGDQLAATIHKFGPSGSDLGVFASFGRVGDSTDYPINIAVDAAGNLYVSGNRYAVEKFSPSGVDLGAFAGGLTLPSGMAFDRSGNLFVVDQSGIHKFGPGGEDLGVFGIAGERPFGLAFDSSGDLFVSTSYGDLGTGTHGAIHEFGPAGEDLGRFASGLDDLNFLAFAPAVPEPSAAALAAIGIAVFAMRRR